MQKMQMKWLIMLALVLLAGCSRAAEPTPQATETSPPPPFGVTYCDIDPADICLEGFGLGSNDELMVMFNVTDQVYTDIYIRADGPDGEIRFECQQSESFAENVYCLGESFPEGELIKLNIYSKGNNKFLAIGVFNVAIGALPESDVIFHSTTTPVPSLVPTTPTPSYPNPAYPNPAYPNPSYPNPTFTSTSTPTSTPTATPR